jgi:Flp pilus assembly protein TadG
MLNIARSRRESERGHSVIEVALMAPWIFFIFVAVVDLGFYTYAAINIENAVRAAAVQLSSSTANATRQDLACNIVTQDMWMLRTIAASPYDAACGSGSLVVTVQDPTPASLDGVAGETDAVVTATYQMIPMIPIPGITGNFTITRAARMRVNNLS